MKKRMTRNKEEQGEGIEKRLEKQVGLSRATLEFQVKIFSLILL